MVGRRARSVAQPAWGLVGNSACGGCDQDAPGYKREDQGGPKFEVDSGSVHGCGHPNMPSVSLARSSLAHHQPVE